MLYALTIKAVILPDKSNVKVEEKSKQLVCYILIGIS